MTPGHTQNHKIKQAGKGKTRYTTPYLTKLQKEAVKDFVNTILERDKVIPENKENQA